MCDKLVKSNNTSRLPTSSRHDQGAGEAVLPDIAWCEVPAGLFLLGANADEEAWDDEHPQHELALPAFYIARYPITNAQFAPFVKGGGYNDPQCWTEAGWAWRDGADSDLSPIPDEDLRKRYADWLAQRPSDRRHEPFYWHDERLNQPNQPVVGVSWHEAMAYCAWLTEQFRVSPKGDLSASYELRVWRDGKLGTHNSEPETLMARLPAEAEWERAAGWAPVARHKRAYAWGDEWDEEKANVADKVGRPSAVGVFPAGAAACGALDMTGNVWEWTLSSWGSFDWNEPGFRYPFSDARPQFEAGGREAPETPGFRVLRGGS